MMKRIIALFLVVGTVSAQAPRDPSREGPAIVAEAFGRLSGALAEAMANGGPVGALPVCSEKAPAIAKEVAARHGVTVRRATLRARNPKNRASGEEKAILDAFAASLEKKEVPQPKVVENADGSRTFYAPIVLQNGLCLQCHGKPGHEIATATLESIRQRYPDDQATGFALGDLRGVWVVTFPPSE